MNIKSVLSESGHPLCLQTTSNVHNTNTDDTKYWKRSSASIRIDGNCVRLTRSMWLLEFIRCVDSRCMQIASDSHALKDLPQPSGHSTVQRLYVGIEGAGPKHTRAQKIQKKSPQQRSTVYEKSTRDSASLHAVR